MFRNSGELPNIEVGNDGNDENSGGYRAPHYRFYRRPFIIIWHYDRTFIAMQLIVISIILLIAFAVYLTSYKIPFEDPLTNIKQNFLSSQLVSIIATFVLATLVFLLTKSSKERLVNNLRFIGILYLVLTFIFLGSKIYLDKKYNNEETFESFYNQYAKENNIDGNSKTFNFDFSGISILNEKDDYIKESKSTYTNFSVKAYLYIIIQVVIVGILICLSNRLSNIEKRKQDVFENDDVLFDEEQNVF